MNKIALIGNYPPRMCGIATFTNDLHTGLKENGVTSAVVAMNDGINHYNYPSDVVFEIEQNNIASYINAAEYLHTNKFDAIILQHEFGIFGGKDGKHIIQLLKRLRMPVITTLHTILDNPSENQSFVVNELARLSNMIVSISAKGVDLLREIYGVDDSKIVHIHHGVHEIKDQDLTGLKEKLGVVNKKVLLTFGLLSKNKSIEVVINALPDVVKNYPDLVYIVLGATHPHVLKHEGEDYRHSLIRLVKKLGLEKNVLFINRFVSNEELFSYLKMCDIYVIPYLGEKQISSGTLIYTMGAAKPIISTPFWYAQEMLADNRGLLFDFKDSAQLSDKINLLLADDDLRETIANNAFALARECYWSEIGAKYNDLAGKLIIEEGLSKTEYELEDESELKFEFPPINLNHMQNMTDDTGMLQHARYSIPNRSHGYCTDDNARALLLSVMLQNDVQNVDELNRLTSIYLSFIDYSFNPEKNKFRNFMNYSRDWLDEEGTEDSSGRAIWALGYTSALTNMSNFFLHSNNIFKMGLGAARRLTHPRSLAYASLGLTYHAKAYHEPEVVGLLKEVAGKLYSWFDKTIDNDWMWHDEKVTYGNSRIPQALIFAGWYLKDDKMAKRGIKILDWLIDKQFNEGIFSPIGNNGWLTPNKKAQFDQQPVEASGMIDACLLAELYTKDKKYGSYALKAFSWFTGDNDIGESLYDFSTGGCRDGIMPNGVNLNQGAESTISWLMALYNISLYLRESKKIIND
ncbi:MAG: glycosyltransferase family 4 protein [Fermentimonas sp.]|nr:glycosyltransferase family 4 protein [Fermentimonas sp.]MDD4008797.1 glycosyltransferase family 4 protein [Fermentimonas sp.]MDD4400114.1 glycosyltransferase family 4 protein [Dysgonamonadaceae bacterium]